MTVISTLNIVVSINVIIILFYIECAISYTLYSIMAALFFFLYIFAKYN